MNKLIAGLLAVISAAFLAIKIVLVNAGDETAVGLPYESFIDRMQAGWGWPMVLTAIALTLAMAVVAYFFLPDDGYLADADGLAPEPVSPIILSSAATDAKARVDGLLSRLSDMPREAFDLTARQEFDAIRDSHLPGLEQAHRDARRTVPVGSADANVIDADYAQSLQLLTGTLTKLATDCTARARADLSVQSRFIEMRHASASNPLSLDGEARP